MPSEKHGLLQKTEGKQIRVNMWETSYTLEKRQEDTIHPCPHSIYNKGRR